MGEVKFTPGPWRVDYEAVGDEGDGVTEFARVTGYEPTGDLLDSAGRIVPRTAANEHLKAAAPAMYEALKALADAVSRYIEVGPLKGVRSDLARGRDMAEAALSSSEGRASLKEDGR